MEKTRDELIARVGGILGAADAANVLSAEDAVYIGGIVDALVEEFNAYGFSYIADIDAIEAHQFEALAQWISSHPFDEFGKPDDPAKRAAAEVRIRRLSAGRPVGNVLKTEYM